MKISKKTTLIMGLAVPMLLAGCGHSHTYDYSNPIWNWSEDYSSATVSFKCNECEKTSKPVVATVTVDDKDSSCSEVTYDTYVATATVKGNTITDTKTKENEKLDHDYNLDNPSWFWSEDYSEANATFVCKACGETSKPFYADITVDDQTPTCTEDATDTYVATITVNGKTVTTTKTVIEKATGHTFTALEVRGNYKTTYDALETFDKTNLEVSQVCVDERHKEAVTLENVEILYQNGDKMHGGDTKVTVKVGKLTADINVTVNAVKVAKPNEDPTTFTYNGSEHTYNIPESPFYTVTGNKVTEVGTHQVTVSLNNTSDSTWSDGTTDDLVYEFVINKGVATISGLEETYETTCGILPDFSNVTSSIGVPTITVYSDEELNNRVTFDEITAGTYYVKASIEGNNNFEGAQKVATLIVSHNHGDVELDTSKIGLKGRVCLCGDVIEGSLVTPEDIDFTKNTFGDLINWHPTDAEEKIPDWNPTNIVSEPTWENWGHKATVTKDTITYSNVVDWSTRKLELPKINYSLFTKVSFDINVDKNPASNWTTIACSFDTIDNRDNSFVTIIDIASKTGVLSVTHRADSTYVMNIKYGEVNESLVITDESIINGNSPLCFYTYLLGGGVCNTTLSNLQLFYESEHTFVEKTSDTVIGQVESSCEYCGEKGETRPADFVPDFVNNSYGANIILETAGWDNKVINVSVKNNADNSLSYVANVDYDSSKGHTPLTFGMTLPKMDLRDRDGIVSFPIVANSNNVKLALGDQQTNTITKENVKGALVFSNITESSMTVTVDFNSSIISKNYTNVANVINGKEAFKGLKLIGTAQWERKVTIYAPSYQVPFGLHCEMTSGHAFENLLYGDKYNHGLLYLSISNASWADMTAKLDFYRLDYRKCGKVIYDVGSRNKDSGAIEDNSNNLFLKLDESTTWDVGNSTKVRSYISFEMVGETLKVTAWNEDNSTSVITNEKSVIITDENVIKGLESYSVNMTFGNNWRHFTINSISFID